MKVLMLADTNLAEFIKAIPQIELFHVSFTLFFMLVLGIVKVRMILEGIVIHRSLYGRSMRDGIGSVSES